jgi:hypothetical protein
VINELARGLKPPGKGGGKAEWKVGQVGVGGRASERVSYVMRPGEIERERDRER